MAAVGEGTKRLQQLKKGDLLNCVLPLGNSFTMPTDASQKVLLVGGGVGVAPLLYFGKKLKAMGIEPTFLLGARTAKDVLEKPLFEEVGRVLITTEDGSEGEKGFVTNHSVLSQESFDFISTCGPKPMMMAVAKYAYKNNIECEVSLENKMACGVGACLCCVEKTVDGNKCKAVADLGVTMLAAGIGNIHGKYPENWAGLSFETLDAIQQKTGVMPLVLHGGTGIPADMIKKAIDLGVSKINVNTECQLSFADATRKYIEAGKDLEGKGFDPRKLLAPGAEAIKATVKEKMELFGSVGKAE